MYRALALTAVMLAALVLATACRTSKEATIVEESPAPAPLLQCLPLEQHPDQLVVDPEPITQLDQSDPVGVLESFLAFLAAGKISSAYELVAPSSKQAGDPIVTSVRLDFDSFCAEVASRPDWKFETWKLGASRSDDNGRFWIRVDTGPNLGDRDQALIVRENGSWYVANPIHIIR